MGWKTWQIIHKLNQCLHRICMCKCVYLGGDGVILLIVQSQEYCVGQSRWKMGDFGLSLNSSDWLRWRSKLLSFLIGYHNVNPLFDFTNTHYSRLGNLINVSTVFIYTTVSLRINEVLSYFLCNVIRHKTYHGLRFVVLFPVLSRKLLSFCFTSASVRTKPSLPSVFRSMFILWRFGCVRLWLCVSHALL